MIGDLFTRDPEERNAGAGFIVKEGIGWRGGITDRANAMIQRSTEEDNSDPKQNWALSAHRKLRIRAEK